MRTRSLAVILAGVCLVCVAPARAANQLTNPDFATDLSGWLTATWPVVQTGSQGFTAPGAAQATATSPSGALGGVALRQCTTATAGTLYDFGGMFKIDPTSTTTGGASINVTWYSAPGCSTVISQDTVAASNAVGWQTLATSATAPAGTASALLDLVQSVDNTGTFQAFWDDIYIGPHPTPVELTGFAAE